MDSARPNNPLNDQVKRINLLLHSFLSSHLPTEIVINILDLSEQWLLGYSASLHNGGRVKIISNSEVVLVATPPFSRQDITHLRKVTFDFRSKDQGWCSRRDAGNWTWFDAALCDDVDAADRPQKYHLQHNEQAGKEMKDYRVELRKAEHHEFFMDLRAGDRIALMGCAAFPGWVNYVESASLQLWMVDNLS
ncbi:MAG: hypothetical protein Q9187_003236 [Circinaria calcarea]